jgi:thymidylate synthase
MEELKMKADQEYFKMVNTILEKGNVKEDRTGVGTTSYFGYQMRFDLKDGFPLLNTKKVPFNLIKSELLWFIKGDTNIKFLLEHKNNIWNEWAFKNWIESDQYEGPDMKNFGIRMENDEEFKKIYLEQMKIFKEKILTDEEFSKEFGELGDVYGKQWRSWETTNGGTIDQLKGVINQIKSSPDSRRMIVTAWNPESIESALLPPCHNMFQFYVANGKLSCQLYQRSADSFLGIPFNIASYALLVHLLAKECGLEVGEFIHTIGDAHIYSNHMEQVAEQLSREPFESPQLVLNYENKSIFDLTVDDIELKDYKSHSAIKAPVAV